MTQSKTDWELPAVIASIALMFVGVAWALHWGEVGRAQAQAQMRIHWMDRNTPREISGLKPITWVEFSGEKEK